MLKNWSARPVVDYCGMLAAVQHFYVYGYQLSVKEMFVCILTFLLPISCFPLGIR